MPFLSDILDSINGSKVSAAQSIIEIGKELSAIEEWLEDMDENNVHVAVGVELIQEDDRIFEKAYKVILRLRKSLSTKWDQEKSADLQIAGMNLLVMKYNIAAGEGFRFNQEKSAEFPQIAGLASLDSHGLLMYFQESVDSVQELYLKYFSR